MTGTLPSATVGVEFHFVGVASRTEDFAIWPAAKRQIVNAVIRIREEKDSFLQALWSVMALFSMSKLSLKMWTSQVN